MISIFPLWSSPLNVAIFKQHLHMKNISQLIRYSRVFVPYHDFLNQAFLIVEHKSSLRTLHCRHYNLVNRYRISVLEMTTICSTWRKHFVFFPYSLLNTGFVTRVTRRVPLVEQELLTLPEHLISSPDFNGVYVAQSLAWCVVFCRSLFVLYSFFFWPLCCLSSFDLWILITPLVSSISS